MNSNHTIPLLVIGAIMLLIGVFSLLYPEKIRKYDTRMTRMIKNKDEYLLTVRVLGIVFVIFGALTLIYFFILTFLI